MFIWNFIGLAIGMLWIFRATKKVSIIPVICLIVFSGFDLIGTYVIKGAGEVFRIAHKENWILLIMTLQLSSFTTLLHWVPHMFIAALIITPIIYFYRDKKMPDIIYLFVVISFLFSPFICIGLIPFFAYNCLKQLKRDGIKNIISIPMFTICLFLTSILVLYIMSNNNNGAEMGLVWLVQDLPIRKFVPYFIFFTLIEYGILAYFLKTNIKDKKQKIYFGITMAVMIIFTCIAGGKFNDFSMRATIPALIIIYIFFVQTILEAKDTKNKKVLIVSIIFLVLMSYTAIYEVLGRLEETIDIGGQYNDNLKSLQNYEELDIRRQYIALDFEDTIFNKYIRK